MEPTRNTRALPWGEISYLEWMPETALQFPPIVLLHGAGLDSASLSWSKLGDELSNRGYPVIAPDHPGYGHSAPAPWRSTQERLVLYVSEFLEAMELDEYALGGLSMGGGMTIGHLLTQPSGAVGAMLFGSYGLSRFQFDGRLRRPLHSLTWATVHSGLMVPLMKLYQRRRSWLKASLDSLLHNPEERTEELLEEVLWEARNSSGFDVFGQWQRDQFRRRGLRSDYSARLGELRIPTLIVHGDGDTGIPLSAVRSAAERLPDATLVVVEDAGHWVQRDRPKVVHPAVVEFLERLG